MGKLCKVRYDISGIYGWGDGYYSHELAEAWNRFWADHYGEEIDKFGTFKVGYMHQSSDVLGHPVLYGDSGVCFCHPMEITGTWSSCNSADTEKFESERKAVFDFLTEKLAVYIKSLTEVEIKITESYYVLDETYGEWIVEKSA